jgi:hypothetical protein
MLFRRPLGQWLAALLVTLSVLTAAPAWADLRLLMFEQDGCPWCARWNADIAPAYPKTEEGRAAPLERLDIHAALPDGITLKRMPQFTPTFVLTRDGTEIGRIEGYPGADFFWGLLDGLLQQAAPDPAPAPKAPIKS